MSGMDNSDFVLSCLVWTIQICFIMSGMDNSDLKKNCKNDSPINELHIRFTLVPCKPSSEQN